MTRQPDTGPPANQFHIPVLPSSALVVVVAAAAAAARLLFARRAHFQRDRFALSKTNDIDIVVMFVLRPNLNSVCCFKSFILPNTKKRISLKQVSPARAVAVFPTFFAPRLRLFHGFVAPVCCEGNTSISAEFFGVFFVCFVKKKKNPPEVLGIFRIVFFFSSGRAALYDCSSKK